jgi:diguanylate cyclase (GGDEF)-like protein
MQSDHEWTVLVIDDSTVNLRVAVEHLRSLVGRILTARTGEAGIERALITMPDLILLDVQLPGIDGFETCRRLKQDARTKHIPVIFTTVLNGIDDILNGFAAGGVDYISKPFQVEELLARVNTHLSLYRLQQELHHEVSQRRQAELALRKANQELQRLSALDGLTQIANRRRFDEYLAHAWRAARGQPLGLLLCDVDYFKKYNDQYGHPAGDECLRHVAQALSGVVGHSDDLVARYGGEEFGLILPNTNRSGLEHMAEQARNAVQRLHLRHDYSEIGTHVTLSVGGACCVPGTEHAPAELVAAADQALYDAKRRGRNCAVVAAWTCEQVIPA